ncbi:hypothetical protein HK101_000935 [Irineochytrium annulatum]|nr:hypothetical protein HK101_000935 [Irineochytrium annulatum]
MDEVPQSRRRERKVLGRISDASGPHIWSKDAIEFAADGTFAVRKVVEEPDEKRRDAEDHLERWKRADWADHPLGNAFVHRMFAQLERDGDVQTLAMLCCIFSEPFAYFNVIACDPDTDVSIAI